MSEHDPLQRPFLRPVESEPFWRTKEFVRFAALAAVAVVSLVVFAFMGLGREEARLREEELAKAAWPALTSTERAQRLASQELLFEGALRDTKSGDGFLQTPGYRKLLDSLSRYRPEDVTQRAQRTLDWTTLTTDPEPWRGEFVRMRGLLGGMWAEKLDAQVFDHADVWRGLLTDAEGDNGVLFDILERPVDADSFHRQAVDVEGVYYRNVSYTSEQGVTRTVPWLVVRSIKLVPAAVETSYKATLSDNSLLLVALLLFAVLGGRVLFWSLRKKGRPAAAQAPQTIREVLEANRRKAGIRPPSDAAARAGDGGKTPDEPHSNSSRRP